MAGYEQKKTIKVEESPVHSMNNDHAQIPIEQLCREWMGMGEWDDYY